MVTPVMLATWRQIASASYDQTIKVWDAENAGEALLTLRGHKDNVRAVALDRKSTRLNSSHLP